MINRDLIYHEFNAKYLTYQQVAETFVLNNEFSQIQGKNSMLLMGPRGCGKTTLLKMITPAGLNYWSDDKSDKIKQLIDYFAVYVPSDIQWKNQLEYLNKHLENQETFSQTVTQFLFATNVQIALCKTFRSLIHFSKKEKQEQILIEDVLCKKLIEAWNIERPISGNFNEIELSLEKRVLYVNTIVNKIIFQVPDENIFKLLPDYVFSEFFDLVRISCKIFEHCLNIQDQQKWALCFDELEIAPKFLQIKLIKYLRSVDPKFFFKLTTTPLFTLENNIVEASEGHDFNVVKLWVYDLTALSTWRRFCTELVTERVKRKLNYKEVNIEDIFGKYSLDEIIREELTDPDNFSNDNIEVPKEFQKGTGRGSSVNYLFKQLAKKDVSFRNYLKSRNINSEDPFSYSRSTQQEVFLKYKIDAVYRLIYYKRARRAAPINYGVPYIFDICDGNPRLLIGLIDEILVRSKYEIRNIPISKNQQSQIIIEASERNLRLLKNHPDATEIVRNGEYNLADDIIEPIGKYFYSKATQEEFSKTSPTTFIIDVEIERKLIRLLELALYVGAIVYLDPIESLSNSGLVGKRFRLSSFLTPFFKIPNRVLSQVNLSTILKNEEKKKQQNLNFNS